MTRTHVRIRGFFRGRAGVVFRAGAGWPSGGLVVAGGVEGQAAEQFAGGRR